MDAPEDLPLSSRIESWIDELVQDKRETRPPPSGAEPLDLGEIEGGLRAPEHPNMPAAR